MEAYGSTDLAGQSVGGEDVVVHALVVKVSHVQLD